jgi:hypothetical protein
MPDGAHDPSRMTKRRRPLGAMALEPRLMYDAAAVATASQIWFTTNAMTGSAAGTRIAHVGVDGSGATDVVDNSQAGGSQLTDPSGIVVDPASGKYFVANLQVTPDGTNANPVIYEGSIATGALNPTPIYVGPSLIASAGFTNAQITGLQIDPANGQIYFALSTINPTTANNVPSETGIFRMNEDGTGLTQVVSFPSTSVDTVKNFALDFKDNLAFFTDSGSGTNKLGVANLSTGAVSFMSPTALAAAGVGSGSTVNSGLLSGVAVDSTNDMLYFTTTDTTGSNHNFIFSAPFTVSGSGATATATLGAITTLYNLGSSGVPASIVLDVPDGLFYIANLSDKAGSSTTGGSIEAGSLNGSQPITTVLQTSALAGVTGASEPADLFLEATPSATAGATTTYVEGGPAVTADAGLTASDASGQNFAGATVTISSGFFAGDTLSVNTSGTNIQASYDSATGVLTLSGDDTAAHYQQALETVTFGSSSADASNGGTDLQRTLTWSVTDGVLQSNVANSSIVIHRPPTVVAGDTATFDGGGSPVTLDGAITINDPDGNGSMAGATVAVGSGFTAGDTLNFTNQNGITGSYDAATGVLTLSGTASLAQYQAALDSVTYSFNPGNGDPTAGGGNTSRTISWTVNDGVASSSLVTSTVDTVHVAPTLAAGGTATFTGGGSPVTLDGALGVGDVDSNGNLAGATVAIGSGFTAGDTLNFTGQNGISGSYDATTGVLTLSGTASVANYQAALDSITYSFNPANGDPTAGGGNTARTISWTVNDGVASASDTSTLTTVHVAPSISAGGTATFIGGGAPVTLDSAVTVADVDSNGNLTGATVTISGGFMPGDTLNFANQNGISSSYNASTGVLTLSGKASLASYQAALSSITYSFSPSNGDPTAGGDTTRSISWAVTDGVASSSSATSTVSTVNATHTPPVVSGAGDTVLYAKHGPAVTLDPALTLSDADSNGLLSGATVSISSGFISGDTLSAATSGTAITASYNAGTGVLTLSGQDTLAHYQSVLDSVTYSSANNNPSAGNKDSTRTITWTVNDGASSNNLSAAVTSTVDVVPSLASAIHAPNGPNAAAPTEAPATAAPIFTGSTAPGTGPGAGGDDTITPWPARWGWERRADGDGSHASVDLRHGVVASDSELLASRHDRAASGHHVHRDRGHEPADGKPGLLAQLKAAGRRGLVDERQALLKSLQQQQIAAR